MELHTDLFDQRILQAIPDYTSPPLPDALVATPEMFRGDDVIEEARDVAAAGNCTANGNRCQFAFVPEHFTPSRIGVVFYGGGLVDPRAYSPLAHLVASRYGLPVVVPIFANDLAHAFGTCDSGRLALAKAEFPEVTHWILVGHSWGGIGALTDAWVLPDDVSGLVLIAADVQSVGCGNPIDFTTRDLPMASVTAANDAILNRTRFDLNAKYLANDTLVMNIAGGNHGGFGSYNDSERLPILGQVDGDQTIPLQVQWDLTASAIYHVASRTGVDMPEPMELEMPEVECLTPNVTDTSSARAVLAPWYLVLCSILLYRKWF